MAIERSLSTLLSGGRGQKVPKEACVQRLCHEELGLPHLVSYRHASRMAFLCRVLTEGSVLEGSVRDAFPRHTITHPIS